MLFTWVSEGSSDARTGLLVGLSVGGVVGVPRSGGGSARARAGPATPPRRRPGRDYDAFLTWRLERLDELLREQTGQTGPPVLQVPSHLRTLDTRIEEVELALRELIRNRLNGKKERLPSHVMQKVRERIDNASCKQPGLAQRASQDLATELQYLDLRDLEITITAKALWPEFAELFGTKEALSMRFGQLAELRNAIRHSREVTTIMRNDGEAALGWFREALAATRVTTTTDSVGSPKP